MNHYPRKDAILLPKGDDLDALGRRKIVIRLTTSLDLSKATAVFSLLSYSQSYTSSELVSKTLQVNIDSSITSAFPLGSFCGVFRIYDESGKVMTATSRIPFEVIPAGAEREVRDGTVNIKTVAQQTDDPVNIGIAFFTDYSLITNKPKINGVEVDGDKTSADYGFVGTEDIDRETARAKLAEENLARKIESRITAYVNNEGTLVLTKGDIP